MEQIWQGKPTLNIAIWAIVVFGILFSLCVKYDFNPLWILFGIPIWILISFFVDTLLGLTQYDDGQQ